MRKGQSEWEEAESERLTRVSKEQEVEYSYDADLNGAGPITKASRSKPSFKPTKAVRVERGGKGK